ncbi:MAG: hypothetical protein ABI643_04255 [Candidatus Doudnabacteria bacterium]
MNGKRKVKDKPPRNRFPKFLGSNYTDHALEIVLRIGSMTWTRLEMAATLKCVDYIAARDFVTPVLEDMGIISVESVYGMDPKQFWKRTVPGKPRKGLGIVSMNVLMSLIKHVLRRNPYKWAVGENGDLVTLATMKNREKLAKTAKKKRGKIQ